MPNRCGFGGFSNVANRKGAFYIISSHLLGRKTRSITEASWVDIAGLRRAKYEPTLDFSVCSNHVQLSIFVMLDDQVKNRGSFAIKLVLLPFQRPKPSLANKEPEPVV